MTPYEKTFIRKKILDRKQEIRALRQLPKGQRNEEAIEKLLAKVRRLKEWLHERPRKEPVRVMTKQEFDEVMALPEADSVMVIGTLDELKKAWPVIRGKNISIQGPPEVKEEIMRLYRKEFGKLHMPGFLPRNI